MLHRLFRAAAVAKAAQADAERALSECREKRQAVLRKVYEDLDATQETLTGIETRRNERTQSGIFSH